MRTIKYTTYWSYAGRPVQRQKALAEFLLDVPYLMEHTGVIPPINVLNELLLSGGDSGGMGPGTTWKPFEISSEEHKELVDFYSSADLDALKKTHALIKFDEFVINTELSLLDSYGVWLRESFAKYKKT